MGKHSFNCVVSCAIRHGVGDGPSPIQMYRPRIATYAIKARSKSRLFWLLRHIGES